MNDTRFAPLLTADVVHLMHVLNPAQTRIVGGAVRDILLGTFAAHTDIDLATTALPTEVIQRCEAAGIKVVPTGLAHGTVTAILDNKPYEITTLREDITTDGRHATVAFTADFGTDSTRRDFTINALYVDDEGILYDYHNGVTDMASRTLRFIGTAEERVREDYLRILRYFRFYALLGPHTPDVDAKEAIMAHKKHLKDLANERITTELFKLFSLQHYPTALSLMEEWGVCRALKLPAIQGDIQVLPVDEASLIPPYIARLYSVFGVAIINIPTLNLSKSHKGVVRQLAAAENAIKEAVYTLPALHYLYGRDILHVIYTHLIQQGYGEGENKGEEKGGAYAAALTALPTLPDKEFPVTGEDIKLLGLAEGKALGEILTKGKEWWLHNGLPDRQVSLDYIQDIIKTGRE